MVKTNTVRKIALSFVLLMGSVAACFGQRAHVSRELESLEPATRVNVIVQFKQAVTPGHHQIVRDLGGLLKSSLKSIQGGTYAVTGSAIQSLALNPEGVSISPDRPLHMLLDNTVAAVKRPAASNLALAASGMALAVIDSGIS